MEAGKQEPWSGCQSACQSVTEHILHSPTHSTGGKLESPNENVFGLETEETLGEYSNFEFESDPVPHLLLKKTQN